MKLTDLHFWFYKNYKYVLIRGHLSAFRGILTNLMGQGSHEGLSIRWDFSNFEGMMEQYLPSKSFYNHSRLHQLLR